jgi:orotate phosphoribosyltransferase
MIAVLTKLNPNEIAQICDRLGVFVSGHFELSASGLHSNTRIDTARLFEDEESCDKLCQTLAAQLLDHDRLDTSYDVVVGPATGGAKVAARVATILSEETRRQVSWVTAYKDGYGGFMLCVNDRQLLRGRNTVVVEDAFDSGSSATKVVDLCRQAGANVPVAAAFLGRGYRPEGVSAIVLYTRDAPLYPVPCPECPKPLTPKPSDQLRLEGLFIP